MLRLLGAGLSNPEIAGRLYISRNPPPRQQRAREAGPAEPGGGCRLRGRCLQAGSGHRVGQLPDAGLDASAQHAGMSTTESSESFQISREIAEFYESAFVRLLRAVGADPVPGRRRCTRPPRARRRLRDGNRHPYRRDQVAPGGQAVGVDLNEAMLGVARRVRLRIEFRQADAARLPFADESFETVLSQMALMFFPDRAAAVQEMARVTSAGGVVALLVPGAHEHQLAFARFADLAVRHAGDDARALLTYFLCGDLDQLAWLVSPAAGHHSPHRGGHLPGAVGRRLRRRG